MAIDKVKEYFKTFNKEKDIIELNESSATVELAAKALKTNTDNIAKSLTFLINDKAIMILLSGDSKIDNSKYKGKFNIKAKMIPFDNVEKIIGHAAGGVCPFAINPNIDVYLDESLKKHKYVYPACGSSNSAIKLTIPELEKYSNYKEWIDISK